MPVLTESLSKQKGIRLALLFGSVATGLAGPASDIDLLVVGSISLKQVLRVTRPIQDAVGREINPVVMDTREFRQRRDKKEHLISTVLSGEIVVLVGEVDDAG